MLYEVITCFDIVHQGHIDYLSKAKDLGDKLILGLNTDASVQRLKGPLRPVVDEKSRAILMAALQFIDLVVLFDEDTVITSYSIHYTKLYELEIACQHAER